MFFKNVTEEENLFVAKVINYIRGHAVSKYAGGIFAGGICEVRQHRGIKEIP